MKRPIKLDPKIFGLPSRTNLLVEDGATIALVIDRKSRLLMADSQKILEKISTIKNFRPDYTVLVKTSAPICSKALKVLEQSGIKVVALEKSSLI